MKIDGRKIASEIYEDLKIKVGKLTGQGIVPQIAVILIGDDPASISYITQKKKWSKLIGVKFSLFKYPSTIENGELLRIVKRLNNDSQVHGIIIQRPVPIQIDKQKIINAINPEKDIDGFRIDSPYDVPVAKAVIRVLHEIYSSSDGRHRRPESRSNSSQLANARSNNNFVDWLRKKSITILGRGETAGGPIIRYLQKIGLQPQIITSQTVNPDKILKTSDIVISAVGKRGVIKPEFLKKKVILLGVGMFKETDGKLHGDYLTSEIKPLTSFYTPVIGGVGPINVAFLIDNLVKAAERVVIASD